MFSFKHAKWILIAILSIFIFTYSHRYSSKERYPVSEKRMTNCANGQKCSSESTKETKPITVKPIKRTIKRVVNVTILEKIHILPKDQTNDPHEIILPSKSGKSEHKKLLIISYFDWGVPHIGDILSHHPQIFYFNEPLYLFDSTTLKDGEEPISRRLVTEATEYLQELFECKILESSMGYSDQMIKKMAKRAHSLCTNDFGNVSECIQSSCRSSKAIISKTIRLYIQDVRSILSKSKGLIKVIILQRDPRVNLNNRNQKLKPGSTVGSDMFFQGRSLCSRMLHDIQEAKRLEGSGFKDFYRIILYEHFLKSPEKVLKGLFLFLGLPYNEEKIRKILQQSGAYKQIRRILLNKWDWLPEEDACIQIDKACTFFYKNSLYTPMKRSHGYLQRYNLCKYCD